MHRFRNPIAIFLVALSTVAFAQESDPFGGGVDDDPFGGAPFNDPFVGSPNAKAVAKPAAKAIRVTKQALPTADDLTRVDYAPSAVEARIRAAMSDTTSVRFLETPLQEVVSEISKAHEIPIVIDNRALEEIGLSRSEPVSLALHNVSLRSTLRLLLRSLDLAFITKDQVLQITSKEQAIQQMTFEAYPLPTVLAGKQEQLLTALLATVTPDDWSTNGGPCHASSVDDVLVITATESVHARVIDFLQKLQAAFEAQAAQAKIP